MKTRGLTEQRGYFFIPEAGDAAGNLRFSDNILMAVIAEGKCTFYQEDDSADIQGDGKDNLKHNSIHLLLQN